MGLPQHYSQELPQRCLHLIETLWSASEEVGFPGQEHLGPLTTTFLLALATPIITLPVERLERHRQRAERGEEGYMDDRPLNPDLALAVDAALGERPLHQSPFFADHDWRFVSFAYEVGQNLAISFPEQMSAQLCQPEARDAAYDLPAKEWVSCLRNALAHCGVVYLDGEGYQSDGGRAEMLAFVSAQYPKGNMRLPPERLRVLRITESSFRAFLQSWVGWLHSSGLSDRLAA